MKLWLLLSFAVTTVFVQGAQDGVAVKPPMGWRSWNQFQSSATQKTMTDAFAALADRSRLINGTYSIPTFPLAKNDHSIGKSMSLSDIGYSDAGIDDYWQKCGTYGPKNYTYHDANGIPVVDLVKFPSLKAMCDVAHALNLTCGWYGNNCGCHDHCSDPACFAGTVDAALAYGFDSIKLDGCGAEENIEVFPRNPLPGILTLPNFCS